jgi:medium-chain acyl-[acyl-carrier-protein] hydrolase
MINEITAASRWVDCSPSRMARIRLFCFPYAGGTATVYRQWPQYLGGMAELCPVHLPGRGRRLTEPLFTDVASAVDAAVSAIAPHCDVPFALFGHSMGAILAYEFARELSRRCGREPVHLFVSARSAPQVPPRPPRAPYGLPDDEFLRAMRDLDDGTPLALLTDAEIKDVFLPILRADFQLVQTYRPEPGGRLQCPVTALGGLKDRHVGRDDLTAWQLVTSGPFNVTMLPGGHFFLNERADAVCQLVAVQLQRSGRPARRGAGTARAEVRS